MYSVNYSVQQSHRYCYHIRQERPWCVSTKQAVPVDAFHFNKGKQRAKSVHSTNHHTLARLERSSKQAREPKRDAEPHMGAFRITRRQMHTLWALARSRPVGLRIILNPT